MCYMNEPRKLVAALLWITAALTTVVLTAHAIVYWRVMQPLTQMVTYEIIPVIETAAVLYAEVIQEISQLLFPVLNDMAMVTGSTMNAATVITVYSLYVWTDIAIQTVQAVTVFSFTVSSYEIPIKGNVPGGIAVWLLILFALSTYAFVYHQYPSHEDWIASVISIVLPLLTRSLWKSD